MSSMRHRTSLQHSKCMEAEGWAGAHCLWRGQSALQPAEQVPPIGAVSMRLEDGGTAAGIQAIRPTPAAAGSLVVQQMSPSQPLSQHCWLGAVPHTNLPEAG